MTTLKFLELKANRAIFWNFGLQSLSIQAKLNWEGIHAFIKWDLCERILSFYGSQIRLFNRILRVYRYIILLQYGVIKLGISGRRWCVGRFFCLMNLRYTRWNCSSHFNLNPVFVKLIWDNHVQIATLIWDANCRFNTGHPLFSLFLQITTI